MNGNFVAYYRVSTDRQGRSGLGFDAQKQAVTAYLNGGKWSLLNEFVEVESGKNNARPQLEAAIALCRRKKAKLIIAKLDRLSRNLAFIATLMESGIEFVAADNPHANKLTVHILAAVAQNEREMIAERTKAALAAAKARGTRLGRYGADVLAPANRKGAIDHAREIAPALADMISDGLSLRAMAGRLDESGIKAARGGKWSAMAVKRALQRVSELRP